MKGGAVAAIARTGRPKITLDGVCRIFYRLQVAHRARKRATTQKGPTNWPLEHRKKGRKAGPRLIGDPLVGQRALAVGYHLPDEPGLRIEFVGIENFLDRVARPVGIDEARVAPRDFDGGG
ncbi:hypothetical protein QFZ99_001452 [Paraburkholderia atlantica]